MSELMPSIAHNEPLVPLPINEEELAKFLADPEKRIFSGALYKIMVKGDDEAEEAMVMPFSGTAGMEPVTTSWALSWYLVFVHSECRALHVHNQSQAVGQGLHSL